MLFDAVLNGFAILSTIVATLRAGSRVAYISNHGAIGLVDGPRIIPPTTPAAIDQDENKTGINSTKPTTITGNKDSYNPALYELAENFKQCVMVSSSRATEDSRHSCENIFRDRPISDIPQISSSRTDPKQLESTDTSSKKILQQFRNKIRFLGTQEEQKLTKKDPFGDKAYTLGYAHYAPKTFQENNTDKSRELVTKAVREALYNYEGSFDFGMATEADYFYNTVFHSPESTTKRRRVAQLKAYCPKTFGSLRGSFGISEEVYLKAMTESMVSFQSNSKGAARAGGIFFFTSDGAYMIKTIPSREKKTLLKMLPDYYDHMKRNGRSSLLTRFCGMYGITIEEEDEVTTVGANQHSSKDILNNPTDSDNGSSTSSFAPTSKEYTFVVMNAVFPAEASTFISERFDLKGSTVGREVSREELESKGSMAVLKDLDLSREVDLVRSKQKEQEEEERILWNNQQRRNRWWGLVKHKKFSSRMRKKDDLAGFAIGATKKAALLSQLRKDVQFLTKCQVMDYSLLVGVVHTDAIVDRNTGPHASNKFLTPEIIGTIEQQNKILEELEKPTESLTNPKKYPKLDSAFIHTLTTPVRLMLSPPLFIARKTWNAVRLTVDSIVTAPMPYYGSGQCGVYGGKLSILNGKRKGERAIYYLGLIDFLQPWTTRKVMERKIKGLAGYDTNAISAVTPEEYATRFLEFLDKHIN